MRRFFIILSLAYCVSASAQDAQDTTVIARIRDEALLHSQVTNIAFHLTDASGPRLSNSPGLARAQQWAVTTLRSWGLANVALEPWGTFGKGWELRKDYLAMVKPYYQPLIAYPDAWTRGSDGPFTTELVLYHPKDSADQAALRGRLRGKLVLFPSTASIRLPFEAEAARYRDSDLEKMTLPPPPPAQPVHGPVPSPPRRAMASAPRRPSMVGTTQFLQQEGVMGTLASSFYDRDGTVYVQGGGRSGWGDSLSPMRLQLAFEHFKQLQALLENGIAVTVEGDIETHDIRTDSMGYNLVGEIPGEDPALKNQWVIIGAHLDSWQSATGATDNGAGAAVMLEVIRILTTIQAHPRRSIRVILWSGEEQGLLGSMAYVKRHFEDPVTRQPTSDQANVSAYFNLDNGSGKIRGVYLQGDTAAGPIFQKWLEPFHDLGATTVTYKNTGGTDHLSFVSVGIPGFQFIQDPIEYETRTHHSNMDTYAHLLPEDLKQAAATIASFTFLTAMRNELIPRAR